MAIITAPRATKPRAISIDGEEVMEEVLLPKVVSVKQTFLFKLYVFAFCLLVGSCISILLSIYHKIGLFLGFW